jgi:hypothetical protein
MKRDQRGGGRDRQHDPSAVDGTAENVARELIATEKKVDAGCLVDGSGDRIHHDRDLHARVERCDDVGEDRREEPEATDRDANDTGAALEEMAEETESRLRPPHADASGPRRARPARSAR